MTVRPAPTPPSAHERPRPADSWECSHARTELAQSIAGVYVGFGTMAATAETGAGMVVGAAITGLAVGDTIVKSDAADRACGTGRYGPPPR